MTGNKAEDWFIRHGIEDPDSGDKWHPYDDVEGNFSSTFEQEGICMNMYASGFSSNVGSWWDWASEGFISLLEDPTPGGCEHDGKWRGRFYDNWSNSSFIKFQIDTITALNYDPAHGPSSETIASQFYKHYVTSCGCSDSSYNNQTDCVDEGYSWDCETNYVVNSDVRYNDFNFVVKNIIQVPEDGRYTFETYRDDGMKIEIDNVLVYDQWHCHWFQWHQQWHQGKSGDGYGTCNNYTCDEGDGSFTVDLKAGNHNIKVSGYENSGAARWKLKWYVKPSDDDENIPAEGSNGNQIPVTGTDGLLVTMRGAVLNKGYVLNSEDLEDFYPDADVRNPISLGSSNAVLYKYYDRDLQPDSYEETSAPLTAQVFFYLRSTKNAFGEPVNMFEPTVVLEDEMQKGNMYVGFIDWGDGSKIEYDKEPFQLGHSTVLTHTYEKSGIYEIRGDMFRVKRSTGDDLSTIEIEDNIGQSLGITKFKEFLLRINIGKNSDVEGEFKLLGGTGYDFIPYNETSPVVSGISNYSLYKKQLNVMNGVIRE